MASTYNKRMLALAIAGATAASGALAVSPAAKAYTQQQVQQYTLNRGNDQPFTSGWVVRENTQYITFDQKNPFYYLDLNDCYEWRVVNGKQIVDVSPNLQQDERGNIWATGIKLTPTQDNLNGIVELHLRDQNGRITIYYLCITNNFGTVPSNPVVRTVTKTATVTNTQTKTSDPVTVTAAPVTLPAKTITETPEPELIEVTKTVEGKPVVETVTETAEPVTKTVTPEVLTETVTYYREKDEPVTETVTKIVTPAVVTKTVEGKSTVVTETVSAEPVTETVTTTLPVEKDSKGTETVIVNNNVVNNNNINNNVVNNNTQIVVTGDDADTVVKNIDVNLANGFNNINNNVTINGDYTGSKIEVSDDSKVNVDIDNNGNIITSAGDNAQVGDVVTVTIDGRINVNVNISGETTSNQDDRSTYNIVRKSIHSNQDVVLGKQGGGSKFNIVEGSALVTVYLDENGEYRFIPVEGAQGKVVIEETREGKVITRYVFDITKQAIGERTITINNTGSVNIKTRPETNIIRVAQGSENLVKVEKNKDGDYAVLPKGPLGTAVVEVVHPETGRVIDRYNIEIQETIKSFNILSIQQLKINPVVEGNKLVVVEGSDLGKLDGNTFVPNDDAEGRVVVHEVDGDGNRVAKYIINVTRGAFKHDIYNTDEFLISYEKNSRIKVTQGKDLVTYEKKTINGREVWVVTPKKGVQGVATVDVIVNINGEDRVVSRYYLNIRDKERNTQIEDKYSDDGETIIVKPGANGETPKVIEGESLVVVKPGKDGSIEITPKDPTKQGAVIVVSPSKDGNGEIDKQTNIIINGEDPETAEGKPNILMPENGKDGRPITILLPKGAGELRIVDKDGKPLASGSGLTLVQDPKTGRYELKWSGDVDTTPEFKLQWLEGGKVVWENTGRATKDENGNSVITFIKKDVTINAGKNGSAQGSSAPELDGKCIAGIVGLTSPLLLAIPLAVLSQVQIPGLEGLSAQVNGAIKDANTRIQQGLGIFNEDRAARAAGFQGAFNIQNPEMLGMAGGALAAITLGLLAVDGLMRACGAAEYTSSYQVGKATGNENLMGLSSVEVEEDANQGGSSQDNGSSQK